MPAWKRLDLVGKMWWIILNWKAINFESLFIKKATRTLCGYFLLWNRDLVFCSLMLRCCLEGLQEEHFGASCFDLCFLPFCRNGSDEAIVQYWCTLVFTLRVSSSTERMVLSSFKNCLIRVIWALNKGLKKEEEGLYGARYRPSCKMHTTLWFTRSLFPGFLSLWEWEKELKGKFSKKLWCCVGEEYYKIIWFYQLGW